MLDARSEKPLHTKMLDVFHVIVSSEGVLKILISPKNKCDLHK